MNLTFKFLEDTQGFKYYLLEEYSGRYSEINNNGYVAFDIEKNADMGRFDHIQYKRKISENWHGFHLWSKQKKTIDLVNEFVAYIKDYINDEKEYEKLITEIKDSQSFMYNGFCQLLIQEDDMGVKLDVIEVIN